VKRAAVFVAVSLLLILTCTPRSQADSRPIRPGDSGAQVARLQRQLAADGYTVTVDGQYGPQTQRAVRHWQKANGLVADAIVGPKTRATLDMSPPALRRPAPPAGPSPAGGATTSVDQIIRDVWPDESEDRAVAIATRESRLVPTARNACCYGLFQINWPAHRSWLARYGVTSPAQLLDARTNTVVALALFTAEGGWSPAWDL